MIWFSTNFVHTIGKPVVGENPVLVSPCPYRVPFEGVHVGLLPGDLRVDFGLSMGGWEEERW